MNELSLEELLQDMDCQKIKATGSNLMATCPFAQWTHAKGKDRHPSFSIEVNGGGDSRWNCFACANKGRSVSSLVWKYKGFTGRDMSRWLDEARKDKPPSAREVWRPRIFDTQPDTWGRHQWFAVKNEPKFDIKDFEGNLTQIPAYALTRGITVEQAIAWKLGFDKKRNRLFIPIFDQYGSMVGWSGRAIGVQQSPKYLHAPGFVKENYLYGEHRIRRDVSRAYLCEGFMDVWNLDRFGLANPLAFFGMGIGEAQIVKIHKAFKEVVIFPHDDAQPEKASRDNPDRLGAGMLIAKSWERALRDVGVKVIIGPTISGKKDVGDWEPCEIQWALRTIEENTA